MPIQSIFPNYAGGENRVTLALLAVCERISIQLLEQIFRYAIEDDTFSVVQFTPQPRLLERSVAQTAKEQLRAVTCLR